jgi:tight adherence protein C
MKDLYPNCNDLALANISLLEYKKNLRTRLLIACAVVLVVPLIMLILEISFPITMVFLLLFTVPIVLWFQASRAVSSVAIQRRGDMDLATAVFLDLVNVLLAGGAGVETAILTAAASGDGWGFSQIRLSIARSQSARQSYWDGLRELGHSLGVDSLVDVANSVQLAGEHGARIRQSLSAKATLLRQKNLARIEYEAEQRTEKMGLPIVLLFLGFILLVGYPAFVGTIGAL